MKYLKSYMLFESYDPLTLKDILVNIEDDGFTYFIEEYPDTDLIQITINSVDPSINDTTDHLINYMIEEGYDHFVGKSTSETIISLLKPSEKNIDKEKYFTDTLKSYTKKTSKDYPGDFFWVNKDNEVVFWQDQKNGYFRCHYDIFYSVFLSKYHIQDKEWQEFMRYLLGKHLKLEGLTPLVIFTLPVSQLGKHLKLEGLTPRKTIKAIPGFTG